MKQTDVLGPFLDVQLQALRTPEGKVSSRKSVVLDPNGHSQEVGVVSGDYKLVPNREVVGVAEELLEGTRLRFAEQTPMFNGKKFRQRYVLNDVCGEVKVGDLVAVTLDAVNSYDGSTTFGLEFNAVRLVCENGMMLSFLLGGFRFKHWGDTNFDQELRYAAQQLELLGNRLHLVLPMLSQMTKKRMKRSDVQKFFTETDMPWTTRARIFHAIEEDSQWGVYNAATDVLTRAESFSADNLNKRVSQYFLTPN
ncbi:DUF945 domain-containing protein [bacterium]|nr:DUF945 domain-containing protein [bacterium]